MGLEILNEGFISKYVKPKKKVNESVRERNKKTAHESLKSKNHKGRKRKTLVKESLKIICDIDDYKPWSGAVDTYNRIKDAGLLDQLDIILEDVYPEGITETQLNDIFWFEPEWCYEMVGLSDEDDDKVFNVSNIDWDVDDESDLEDLPNELEIDATDLLYSGEKLRDFDDEELKDRVADYLSDRYGFTINSLSIDVVNESLKSNRKHKKLNERRSIGRYFEPAYSERYKVLAFYGNDYRGLVDDFSSDDFDEISDKAHEFLSNGNLIVVNDYETGKQIRLTPDDYFDDFEGEGILPYMFESLKSNKKLNENLMDAIFDRIDDPDYYDPKQFYNYLSGWNDWGWYNNVVSAMDGGTDDDVRKQIIYSVRKIIKDDGGNPDNPNAKQLYDWINKSTWITNDVTAEKPEYLKNI